MAMAYPVNNNLDKGSGNILLLNSQATRKNQKTTELNGLNHNIKKKGNYVDLLL